MTYSDFLFSSQSSCFSFATRCWALDRLLRDWMYLTCCKKTRNDEHRILSVFLNAIKKINNTWALMLDNPYLHPIFALCILPLCILETLQWIMGHFIKGLHFVSTWHPRYNMWRELRKFVPLFILELNHFKRKTMLNDYLHAFLKKAKGLLLLPLSACPSVMLYPPKPLGEIQPNLVCELLT